LSEAVTLTPFDSDLVERWANRMYNNSREPYKGGQGMNQYIRHKIFMPGSTPPEIDGRLSYESLPDSARRNKVDLPNILAELQTRYYTADRMYLVLLLNHSLDDQTQLVVDIFASIPRSSDKSDKNTLLDPPKLNNNSNQIRQTGFGIKTGASHPPPLLEAQFMNRLGATIPRHIRGFIEHCVYTATGPSFLFGDFLRNQSLASGIVSPGQLDEEVDVYGFSYWLSDFGAQNLDLILNHTFRHINAAKSCLANSSEYGDYANFTWGLINDKVTWWL